MSRLYIRFVASIYLKYFFIIFAALELFYVGVDVLTNLKDLPSSANLQLLYACFLALSASSYTLPLSLIFAIIAACINLIRSNELVSFYALGISKKRVIAPAFLIALFITLIFVGLNFTPFAYASSYQREIIKGGSLASGISSDAFLKFDGKFIYIKQLDKTAKTMQDIKIFELDGTRLNSYLSSDMASFDGKEWRLDRASLSTIAKSKDLGTKGLSKELLKDFNTLAGFSPKSIEQASNSTKAISGLDALEFIAAFKNEGVSLSGIRASFYMLVFTPFYAPLLVFIFYCHMPIMGRFLNLALASFVMIVSTLVVWAFIFILARLALNGVLSPELALIAPILAILAYAVYLYKGLE